MVDQGAGSLMRFLSNVYNRGLEVGLFCLGQGNGVGCRRYKDPSRECMDSIGFRNYKGSLWL